ncbi:MAG: cation diffusion facilitator family transporter [Streptosporangiales bacterium]|nr:cation diffusion facilitator family transporter [Streptosporangiales bacterium]
MWRLWSAVRRIVVPHSHDSTDRIDSALEASSRGIRALLFSFAALMVTAVLQAVVVGLSGSVALLGDTLHNVADALTAVPLAVAFLLGRRAVTRRFTYGLGRTEDLAGIVIVILIALSSFAAGYEAVRRLVDPQEVHQLVLVAIAGVVGFLGNELVARYRIRVGRQIGSAALVADGLHARTDALTSLVVVGAAIGTWLRIPYADPIIGLGITVMIAFVLKDAAKEVFSRLLDAVDPALVTQAEATLAETGGVRDVTDVRMRWVGHALHLETTLTADPRASLVDAHAVAVDAEHRLRHALPRLARATVHVDPHPEDGDGTRVDHHEELAHHLVRV